MRTFARILFFFCFGMSVLAAGARDVVWTELPTQGQLPVANIHRLLQDGEGYMWYGTEGGGLCRDDGYDVDVFRSDALTPRLLGSNSVTCLAEDGHGRIYIGTTEGLYVLDKADYGIKPWATGIPLARLRTEAVMAAADGTLWAAAGGTVYHYSFQGQLLEEFPSEWDGSRVSVSGLCEDRGRHVYVSQWGGGLLRYDPARRQMEACAWPYAYSPIQMTEEGQTGRFWVATWGGGIVSYIPGEDVRREARVVVHPATGEGDDRSRVLGMAWDEGQRRVWVASLDNLYAYDWRGGTLEAVDLEGILPAGKKILDQPVADRWGNVWVPGYSPHTFILSRPAEGAMAALIEAVNRCGAYRVAVDIPSGVDGATGRCPGAAVLADETVTFQYPKRGLLLFPGRAQAGRLTVHPIAPVYPVKSDVHWFEEADAAALLPPRAMDSHKGKNGRALLVAGCGRYTGAALMSAMAALRGGAGLLTVAVPAALKGAFAQLPEAMCVPCGAGDAWDAAAQADAARLLGGRTALGIGSGMGEMESAPLLAEALRTGLPTVLDADALNALSRERGLLRLLHARCVLTPHPAEMARLCDCETAAVTADPVAAAREAAARFGCVVLLKGATSCISDGRDVYLNTSGNPGLAKGGSGDVLTGIALALLAQGLKPLEAACAASYLLGASADRAYAILGNRMLLAGDVIDAISQEIRAGRVR